MLQQEMRASEMVGSDAAHVRVTPEELAQAAAALEIRQLVEQQQRAQTIALGEAATELGLGSTPEELLAEVEAERARRKDLHLRQHQARSKRRLLAGAGTAVSLAIISALGLSVLHLRQQLRDALRPLPSLPVRTLASVPDNLPVHCDLATLNTLAAGTAALDVNVDARPETVDTARNGAFNHEWTLVKSGGTVYVQAWATAENALSAANQQSASVFSNRPPWLPTSNTVSVRLPADRFDRPTIAEYTPQGELPKDGMTGTVYGATIPGMGDILQTSVDEATVGATTGTNPATNHNMNQISVDIANGEAHLKGYVSKKSRKKQAEQLMEAAIQRHNLPLRPVNDLEVENSPDFSD